MAFNFVPFSGGEDLILLLVRIFLGAVMIYFGYFKVKDFKANGKSFDKMGFKPGIFFGTIVALLEFFGGILIVLGVFAGVFAALFGFQMLVGTIWKISKGKGFTDWSYDVLLLGLVLVLLTFGSGGFSLI